MLVQSMKRAASSFKVDHSPSHSIFQLRGINDPWVKFEDINDILLVGGVYYTEEALSNICLKMKVFIAPEKMDNKVSFHVRFTY